MCKAAADLHEFIMIGMRGTVIYCSLLTSGFCVLLCSIRLGIFLRRYPIARAFVIIYMVSQLSLKKEA